MFATSIQDPTIVLSASPTASGGIGGAHHSAAPTASGGIGGAHHSAAPTASGGIGGA